MPGSSTSPMCALREMPSRRSGCPAPCSLRSRTGSASSRTHRTRTSPGNSFRGSNREAPASATSVRPGSSRRVEMGRRTFAITSFLALLALLAFLVLPIVAIFTHTGPGRLVDALGDESSREALRLSFETSAIAMLLIVMIGTPAAYLLATRSFRGRAAILTLIELPLIVPPAVAGLALLAAFGPDGLIGSALSDAGIELVFETAGVVVALTFVASPFYVRAAVAAFAAVPRSMIEASEQLGAQPLRTLVSVAMPSARAGLLAGFSLALGRALGEFGAPLMFAGSFPGTTQTAPLAIFSEFNTDFTGALALGAVLIALVGALLLSVKLVAGREALGAQI